MFIIIGLAIVIVCIIVGYVMHHGDLRVLFQINEFIIIGGAALGSLLIANPLPTIKKIIAGAIGTLK